MRIRQTLFHCAKYSITQAHFSTSDLSSFIGIPISFVITFASLSLSCLKTWVLHHIDIQLFSVYLFSTHKMHSELYSFIYLFFSPPFVYINYFFCCRIYCL